MPDNDVIQTPTLEIPVELDLKTAEQSFREMERTAKRSGDQTGKVLGDAGGETKKFTARVRDAAVAVGGLTVLLSRKLLGGMKGVGKVVGGVAKHFVDFAAIGILGVSRGLRRLDVELEDNGRGWKQLGDAAGGAASVLETVAKLVIRVSAALTGMKLAAGATAAAMVIAANRASQEFTPAWNRVLTLLEGTPEQLAVLRNEVSMLAGELGVTGPEAADTFYEILSAAPQLAKEPTRALEALRVALEGGATGFVESAEAAKTNMAILDAFNLEVEESRRVSDALFAAQDQGVLTFGEIAGSIGRVSSQASELGVEFEELLGIAAQLTPTGQSVAEIFTQVRAVLNGVLRPTAEARREAERLGLDFSAAALRGQGLIPFLEGVMEATNGSSDALARLFTSQEALSLMVALSGDLDDLAGVVEKIAAASGETADKLDQMNQSAERQKEIFKNQLKASLRGVGDEFERLEVVGLKGLNALIGASLELDRVLQNLGGDSPFGLGDAAGQGIRGWIQGLFDDTEQVRQSAEEARQEIEYLIFGTPALAQNQSIPGVRGGGRVPRPAEPTSVEYSQAKIAEMERLRTAKAIADLARTGDLEAYEAAIRDTQEAVNDLVVAEMERLRAAGVAEAELSKLASAYRVFGEEVDKGAEARKRLAEELNDQLFRLTADAVDMQQRQLDQLRDRFAEVYGQEIPAEVEAGLAKLQEAVDQSRILAGFQDQLRVLQRQPATIETADAMAELYHTLRAEAAQLPENLELRKDYLQLLEAIADAIDRIRQAKKGEDDEEGAAERAKREREEELRQLRDRARTIEENARAMLQLASATGLVDEATARALESMVQLGTAIARVAGDDLTAIPAAIGAAGSLIAGLFGDSPEEQRRREVLEANNAALERLRLGMQELGQVLAGGVAGGEIAAIGQGLGEAFSGGNTGLGLAIAIDRFIADMNKLGITLEDMKGIAAGFGIELDGSLESWRAFLEATQEFQLDQLFTSYAGQLDLLRQEFEIFDIEDPIDQVQRMLEVFRDFAGVPVPEFDLSTAAGRDAAQVWAQEMFRALEAGYLTPSMLGGLTLDEFRSFLTDFERLIETGGGGVVGTASETRLGVNITEEQGSAMISIGMSQLYELRNIRALLGGGALPTVAVPTASSLGLEPAGTTITIQGIDIDVEIPVTTTGGVSAAELRRAGEAAGQAMGRSLKEELGRRHRAAGGYGAPKVQTEGELR